MDSGHNEVIAEESESLTKRINAAPVLASLDLKFRPLAENVNDILV